MSKIVCAVGFLLFTTTAISAESKFPISSKSVEPGTSVLVGGKSTPLYKGSLKVGQKIAGTLGDFDLGTTGKVAVISIVPSIDTPVCEEQTHVLGETTTLNKNVLRVTVSRDLPMAQSRFSKEAKLTNVKYVSDYKKGDFGKRTGLMIKGVELLARAVIVVDKQGVIKHLQVVPDASQLPDMATAFDVANKLAK
jgi:thiol peroxidase